MNRFEGKVAIVTGAAEGIGAAFARALAQQGAAVVVADRNESGKEVADDIGGTFIRTDVSDPDFVRAMAEHAVESFGGIDHLVNNAGICGSLKFDFLIGVDWDYYKNFMGINSVMVRDDDQVDDVVTEVIPSARRGAVVAVHSTIRAGTAVRLAEQARPHGVEVVDAPVSGGFLGASAGTLAVMVGGTEEAFERCREPFGAWAELILHVGPVGAGTHAKLARNLLTFVAFTATAEAQRLAEAAGISLESLARVVRHSDAITGGPGSIKRWPPPEYPMAWIQANRRTPFLPRFP